MAALGLILLVSFPCASVVLVGNDLTNCQRSHLLGKRQGPILMLGGGGYYGQRLNKIYRGLVGSPLYPLSSLISSIFCIA